MVSLSFSHPQYLWALITIPLLIVIHFMVLNYTTAKAFEFANFPALARVSKGFKVNKSIFLLVIRIITLISIVLAVSGTTIWYSGLGSDFDFVLAIDSSSSMLTKDYNPNRLEAAKEAALYFLDDVPPEASLSVISFAGTSFIRRSLSNDKFLVKQAIKEITPEAVGGTDIGEAIVTSANILSNSNKGRAVILLTDGRSNVGLSVSDSIDYAKENHVIVHTIGIGTEEGGSFEGISALLKLDKGNLKNISSGTSGLSFIALDNENIRKAYNEIALSTRRQLSVDLTVSLLLIAILLSIIDWALMNTRYKRIP